MKKMLFLMLFLLILGAANVNSQVRIGGNGQPNGAAVLDLNATDAINNGTKGLALPRVSLTDINTALTGSPTVNGMMVYNTNASVGAGIYYWDTNKWIKVSDGAFTEMDGIVGNEVTDVTGAGGLERTGAGTAESPYMVGIKPNGIVGSMIADKVIPLGKLWTSASDSGKFLMGNGSGVVASGFLQRSSVYATSVPIKAPRAVTWSLVVDTYMVVGFQTNAYTDITVNGLLASDLCTAGATGLLPIMIYGTNHIMMWSGHGGGGSSATRIRCYRPSI